MKRLAIIGTGIAGMACGHYLNRLFDLTLYERNDYPGGHTNTVFALEEGRAIPIDTGFMVYNEPTYPHLTRLFADLGVATQPTSMSFSVQYCADDLEFCGSGLNGLFAQRKNLWSLRFWKLLLEIQRFNAEAPKVLDDPARERMTLKEFAAAEGYSRDLLDRYLIPMSSAVWSTPSDIMLDFPAVTLIRFFKNHGFLGLHTQHPWRTVTGGSKTYRDKIVEPFRDKIQLSRPAKAVRRQGNRVEVTDSTGDTTTFDQVIIASHADQALRMLADATPLEQELLDPFRYQTNTATLHTDASVMPRTRSAWSSWNYRTEGNHATTIYWMNSLQGVSDRRDYFVSINDPGLVDPKKVIKVIDYEHPLFSVEAIQAQKRLSQLNDNGTTYFCGSYFRYGFHEDALVSALEVCRRLGAAV